MFISKSSEASGCIIRKPSLALGETGMVYQVSIVMKEFSVRISWDELAESLAKKLDLPDIVVEKIGSFQCKFIFSDELEAEALKEQVKSAVQEAGKAESFGASAFGVSAKPLTAEDLAKLKPETAGLLKTKDWFSEKELNNSAQETKRTEPAFRSGLVPKGPEERPERPAEGAEPKKEEEGRPKTLEEVAQELASMRKELLRKVRGQRHAVDELTQGYFESELFSRLDPNRKGPISTFLFMGPSGVGKTFLAKEFGKLSGRPVLVVDMSEYSDNLANLKFNGDHGENAVVTGFVRKNPNAILIFDEIEKAHINTIHLFLQILDAGELMDHQLKREISFRDTTVIMTTNVGSDLYDNAGVRNLSGIPRNALINALRSEKKTGAYDRETVFPESITTRMANGHIIMFNHLEPHSLMEIVRDEIALQLELFRQSTGITAEFDPIKLPSLIMYAGGAASDARTLKGLARNAVVKEIQDVVMQANAARDRKLSDLSRLRLTVDIPRQEGEIYELFNQTKGMQALVFAENAAPLENVRTPFLDFHITGDGETFKKKLRGLTDLVLLDPFVGYVPDERAPADLEDIRAAGMEMFEYLLEFYPEIPIYILNSGKNGGRDFSTLLSRGARGVLSLSNEPEAIREALQELSLNALIGNAIYRLGRSGKYLSYNCAQYVLDRSTVEISFANLRLKTAVSGEDYQAVARKGESGGVTFDDIVGCKTAKEELREICEMLDNPRKGILAGKKLPKGILLYGPPGTGKTMLAKAMANQSDAMFLPTTATSFFGSLVGQTEENIREIFKKARRYAPAVIFIDEVDAVARRRTGSVSTSHNEDALNTLLAEMDGFVVDEKRPVFILAATNYDIEGDGNRVLDPAFVRRFDRKLHIPLPDTDARYALFSSSLARHSIHFGEQHEAAVRNMAERSGGMCNADIEMVVELYVRNLGDDAPSGPAFMDALDEYRFGDVKDRDAASLRQTAYHEAGHALVSWVCGVKPLFVTIVSRNDYGGYMETSAENKGTHTFSDLKDIICRCLAGRAAELEVYGEIAGINTGASSDLKKARYLVQACFTEYGMGATYFKRNYAEQGEALMQEQFERARSIVSRNRQALDELVDILVKEKSLDKEAIDAFFRQHAAGGT